MKVYLDLIIFYNFIIDFFLLYGIKVILKRKVSIFRLLCGSFIGGISIFILFLDMDIFKLFIFKLFLSFIIIYTSFGINSFKDNIFYFYILSIILGGTLYLFDFHYILRNISIKFYYFLLSIFVLLIVYLYYKELKKYKLILKNNYIVEIFIGKKIFKLEGMIDTGNQLKDPYKKRSIILVNIKYNYYKQRYLYVPFKVLNGSGIIPCIKPDKILIDNKIFNNCLIGFSNEKFNLNNSECILPNDFKEDL